MSKSILIVDDNRLIRSIMAEMLEHSGFTVRQAADGAEALQMVVASAPDLLITDYLMPNMDGAELTRKVRASDTPTLPILGIAGAKNSEKQLVDAGIDMYLEKPIDAPRLVSGVCSLLHIQMDGQ